jgi:PAS domain S-box-containing protein
MLDGDLLVNSTEELPPDAEVDQESGRRYGIKSSVIIPLSAGGGPLIGVLTFNALKSERTWPEPLVKQLRLVAQVFANTLSRKKGELELRESEARLNMATRSAGVGLWDMDIKNGHVWVTPETRAMLHFTADELLNYNSIFKAIHPEDHETVNQGVRASVQSDVPLQCEYRIIDPGGGVRWIRAGGKRVLGSTGGPARLMGVSIDITESRRMEDQLRAQLEEIESLKRNLEKENIYLREEIELRHLHEEIVYRSPEMKHILGQAEQVARTDATVLIEGETGTGKELLARAVHRLSLRKDRPLVTVNCASLPPTLIESELFGREKGAYTGALSRMTGRFEVADRATLFLDEIGELPIDVQAKLLRVLEQGRFERLGSSREQKADVRIIAATNQDLAGQVAEGRFRKDLYYRLNVFPLHLPPLRERVEDIPPLIWTFVREYEKKIGRRVDHIPRKCMEELQRYSWPGNIRELKNVIERAMIVNSGKTLELRLPQGAVVECSEKLRLEDAERRHIACILEQTGGRVSGKGGAAEILGLKRSTLQFKMKKLGIRRKSE